MAKKSGRKNYEPEQSQQISNQPDSDDDQLQNFATQQQTLNAQLLPLIDGEIAKASEPLKLSWAAIHQLKHQEINNIKQLNKEIDKLTKRYTQLNQQLIKKIGQVASGTALENQIYTQHKLTKQLNLKQHKPEAIPGFWKNVIQSAGLAKQEYDIRLFSNCVAISCDRHQLGEGSEKQQQLELTFQFSANNQIENTTVKIKLTNKSQHYKKSATPVKFKEQPTLNSLTAKIFSLSIDPKKLWSICISFEEAYHNSVYFYFHKMNQNNKDIGSAEEEEEEDDDDDDDDDEDEEDQRPQPTKKKNTRNTDKQPLKKEQLEKPECKNQ